MKIINIFILAIALMSCGKKPDFFVSGKVANPVTQIKKQATGATPKNITHIMAISPESADPKRFITTINKDGSFELGIESGKPYVLVFIATDQGFKGPEMIAGIFKITSNDLDTLVPAKSGKADLGGVNIDQNKKQARMSTTVDALLASLGITQEEASFLGKIDGLSLRSANPDIDGNGVIDALEDKHFHMDWHVRADTQITDLNLIDPNPTEPAPAEPAAQLAPTEADPTEPAPAEPGPTEPAPTEPKKTTRPVRFSDAIGTFISNPIITYSLNSGYAVYPSSYHSDICPANTGVALELAAGCGFDILDLAGVSVLSHWPHTSMSGGSYGDMKQWGPDFRPPEEMPGSAGAGVQMVYKMPGDKTLTFWNVITRTNASLTADGLILPFLKFNTSDGTVSGKLVSIDFEWRKLQAGSWILATATEIEMIVNDNGGYAGFYTQRTPGSESGFSVTIPRDTPSGNIPWDSDHVHTNGSASVSGTTTNSFCNSAISYDDKLGLRIFANGFAANENVTLCP